MAFKQVGFYRPLAISNKPKRLNLHFRQTGLPVWGNPNIRATGDHLRVSIQNSSIYRDMSFLLASALCKPDILATNRKSLSSRLNKRINGDSDIHVNLEASIGHG